MIDGPDKMGKTTAIQYLRKLETKEDVKFLKFPSDNIIKELEHEFRELSTASRQRNPKHVKFETDIIIGLFLNDIMSTLLNTIKENKYSVIVCDRGLLSTFVYNIIPRYLSRDFSFPISMDNESDIENVYNKYIECDKVDLFENCFKTFMSLDIEKYMLRYDNKELVEEFKYLIDLYERYGHTFITHIILHDPDNGINTEEVGKYETVEYKRKFDDNIILQKLVTDVYELLYTFCDKGYISSNSIKATSIKFINIFDGGVDLVYNRKSAYDLATEIHWYISNDEN
jgi:thymidylate kinase